MQSLTSALAGGPRRLPALAAVLALLVLALLPTTGQAQSATLVSNTGQSLGTFSVTIGNTDKRFAQGFTTGTAAYGYHLASVGVHVNDDDFESGETLTVHIYSANASGGLGSLVYTLASPASYTDGAVNLFTAPANATLAANTRYLVVFEATGNNANDFILSQTNSDSEDSGARDGVEHRKCQALG